MVYQRRQTTTRRPAPPRQAKIVTGGRIIPGGSLTVSVYGAALIVRGSSSAESARNTINGLNQSSIPNVAAHRIDQILMCLTPNIAQIAKCIASNFKSMSTNNCIVRVSHFRCCKTTHLRRLYRPCQRSTSKTMVAPASSSRQMNNQ